MPLTAIQTREDTQVRECIFTLAQAIRTKDVDALMGHYAPDIVTFDLMPLQCRGVDAYRKNFEAWFASMQGPIDFEIRELRITAHDDVAFCHYLAHIKSTRTTGEKNDYLVRVTSGFRNLNGRWMVAHEHVSVPYTDRETMRAALAQHL